jgi:iron(II)-dependent oxidoreductase
MDRQSAPQAPRVEPKQPVRAQKSSLLPIALVAVFLSMAIVGSLVYFIFKFREGQKQSFSTTRPTADAATVDATPNATQPAPTPTVQELTPPEGMVAVQAGTYIIGRDDGDDLAGPKHTATLSSFFIDKTEVTNAEYKRFVDATGHAVPAPWQDRTFSQGKANYPVTDVTWQDATDYAAWAAKRLPTEAEWEAAARGRDGRVYPWGNGWRSGVANIEAGSVTEVGKFPESASPTGALDMIGNVWEWTADEFKLYPGNAARLRDLVAPGIVYRVIRGGAYDGSKKNDASYRGYVDASKAYPKTGFRCVKNAG